MVIKYSGTPQGTDAWLAERCGLITASMADKIRGKSSTRLTYLTELAAQRDWGPSVREPSFKSAAMQRGNDLEPEARAMLCFELDRDIDEVGLATNTEYPGCGASLDGLYEDTGIEIKCPLSGTHQGYLSGGGLPAKYRWQVAFQQMICDLSGTIFYSYYPGRDCLLIRVPRLEKEIAELEKEVARANADIQSLQVTL